MQLGECRALTNLRWWHIVLSILHVSDSTPNAKMQKLIQLARLDMKTSQLYVCATAQIIL